MPRVYEEYWISKSTAKICGGIKVIFGYENNVYNCNEDSFESFSHWRMDTLQKIKNLLELIKERERELPENKNYEIPISSEVSELEDCALINPHMKNSLFKRVLSRFGY